MVPQAQAGQHIEQPFGEALQLSFPQEKLSGIDAGFHQFLVKAFLDDAFELILDQFAQFLQIILLHLLAYDADSGLQNVIIQIYLGILTHARIANSRL
ncbi:hypothetical protein DSECCO2_555790 [anaerobic digester metagenome]